MDSSDVKFKTSLIAGAIAGLSVDMVLFPLDSIKTRLQSQQGFHKAGGFKNIYKGITPVFLASAPGAALFFSTYTYSKFYCNQHSLPTLFSNILAACVGETVACFVRVPSEVIKQRRMVSKSKTPLTLCLDTYRTEGLLGFYRGYTSTLLREIPFAILQYPLWEYMKVCWAAYQSSPLLPWQSAVCGCFAGGISAFLTTPIDVAKTRIMLAEKSCEHSKGNVVFTLKQVYEQEALMGLFRGCVPRIMFISIGGAIFLGAYDKASYHLSHLNHFN